ncbi:hypothetical protein MP228_000503 [Amoeboaphelidium protococcarum]|nr:hypothetical protein MP228_000503 [Amoeboaphelidium protococcarum]
MKCNLVIVIAVVFTVQSMNVLHRPQLRVNELSSARSVTRPRVMPVRASFKSSGGGRDSDNDSNGNEDYPIDEQKERLNLIWYSQIGEPDQHSVHQTGDIIDGKMYDILSLSTKCMYGCRENDISRLTQLCDALLQEGQIFDNFMNLHDSEQRQILGNLGTLIAVHVSALNVVEYLPLLEMHFTACKITQSSPYLTVNVLNSYFRELIKSYEVGHDQVDFTIVEHVVEQSNTDEYQEDFASIVFQSISEVLVDIITDVQYGRRKFFAVLLALQKYGVRLGVNRFSGQVYWQLQMRKNNGLMLNLPAPSLSLFAGIIYRFQLTQGQEFGEDPLVRSVLGGISIRRDSIRQPNSQIKPDFEIIFSIIKKDNMDLLNEIALDSINGEWLSRYLNINYVSSFLAQHGRNLNKLVSHFAIVNLKLSYMFSQDPPSLIQYVPLLKVQCMLLQPAMSIVNMVDAIDKDRLTASRQSIVIQIKDFIAHSLITSQDEDLFHRLMWQMLQAYNIIGSDEQFIKEDTWYQITFKALSMFLGDMIQIQRQDILENVRATMQEGFDITFIASAVPGNYQVMISWSYTLDGESKTISFLE